MRAIAGLLALLSAAMATLAADTGRAAQAEIVPAGRVQAVYNITWNGLQLGEFRWESNTNGGKYKLSTTASVSALFGAYSWQGVTRAAGTYSTKAITPAAYAFKFKATDKSGQIDMRFSRGSVTEIEALPVDKGSVGRVPVMPEHKKNVLDPLSAIMALSAPINGGVTQSDPCKRRLPIFDGKQRFDLTLSYARRERLDGGLVGSKSVIVCRVKYKPIAGHKMNTETKYMMSTDGIEIWLAPVPDANVYVPYNIVIPTWAGSAQLTAAKVHIELAGRGVVALSR